LIEQPESGLENLDTKEKPAQKRSSQAIISDNDKLLRNYPMNKTGIPTENEI